MAIKVTQTSSTNSFSKVDYLLQKIFIRENVFQDGTILNNTGAELQVDAGMLVYRDVTTGNLIPITDDSDKTILEGVIGILALNESVILDSAETYDIRYCTGGWINASEISLPGTWNLSTAATDGNGSFEMTIKDVLVNLFHIQESTTYSKNDN